MLNRLKILLFLLLFTFYLGYSQGDPISLYSQFNGRFQFTTIGNTLNTAENNISNNCSILTSSSATLTLTAGTGVEAAYLYWAGSGTGDFDVQLNGTPITAERTFNDVVVTSGVSRTYFAAFADVTSLVQTLGSGLYTLSDLDLTGFIYPGSGTNFCSNATNFGGWAITIILENDSYPLNQVNIYDGLEHVPNSINIDLDNLLVISTEGAQIGFLAWEGDAVLATESLYINGIPVGNPPLNPVGNAFNGTNSFTGSNTLYNMDIDYYDLQNYISEGDTNVSISLTSSQDVVLVNNVITVLNSFVIADAGVEDLQTSVECDSRTVDVTFYVTNYNSSAAIPAGTTVTIYADDTLLETLTTQQLFPEETQLFSTSVTIPSTIPDNFTLTIKVDEENNVEEIDETNNEISVTITLIHSPEIPQLPDMDTCDIGFNTGIFDLEANTPEVSEITFSGYFTTEEDAELLYSPILNTTNYQSTGQNQTVYYRYDNEFCYSIGLFTLSAYNCLPVIPQGFSPNGDTKNDTFNIQGLWDVFDKFSLKIYNRYGTLVYEGDQNTNPWDGIANHNTFAGKKAPVGTYYYVLVLQDEIFRTYTGWVYLNR